MKKTKDIVGDFWNNYWNADCLKRMKIIESTKCFDRTFDLMNAKKMTKKLKKYAFNQLLMSYFDDLLSTLEK